MSEILGDGEFWLPPRFLADDDVSDEVNLNNGDGFSFHYPFGCSSDLSPSVVGSTETAQLCSVGSGCMFRQEPSLPCEAYAPPETWDLLYAAAGEVARMRINNEDRMEYGFNQSSKSSVVPPGNPSPVGVPVNPDDEFYHQRLRAAQFEMLRKTQQQLQRSEGWGGHVKGTGQFRPHPVVPNCNFTGHGGCRSFSPLGLSSSVWPPLHQSQSQQQQQQNATDMGIVFVGAKRECAGTGVFLPRRKVGAWETPKKPVRSKVLRPARPVKALKSNLEEMGSQAQLQPQPQPRCNNENNASLRLPSRNAAHRSSSNVGKLNQEQKIWLPQKWTY